MLRLALQICILCALVGAATALTYYYHPNRPALYLVQEAAEQRGNTQEITIEEALRKQAAGGVLWIDARQRATFEKEHVPGAMLLNEQEYQTLIVSVAQQIQEHQDKPIIVYCDAKKCDASRHIAEELRAFVPDPELVFVLHGGFQAWQDATK